MNEKIFITGATGFIGRRLVNRLINEHIQVIALVRKSNHNLPLSDLLHITEGSLFDIDLLAHLMKDCTIGYHLAASIDFNHENKDYIYKVNVDGTKFFLEAAKKSGLHKVVFVSSACTIGISWENHKILDENTEFNSKLLAHNVYLASKKLAEDLVLSYKDIMKVVIANPTTVYGPGDYSLNSGTIIKTIVKNKIVPVFPGGTSVVDVDDVVAGLMLLGRKNTLYDRYILTNENLKFSEVFSIISSVTGKRNLFVKIPKYFRLPVRYFTCILSLLFKFLGLKAGLFTPQIIEDTFLFKYYDGKRIKDELGWLPEYNFKETIERAWEFYLHEGLF
ncbi:MAG: NAD-dependent epimerase/dehydratase family protein [Candidatus Eremiobacterota bacterium]